MTVAMVPRDQLQACAAANRMLRDELARVEGERDALAEALRQIASGEPVTRDAGEATMSGGQHARYVTFLLPHEVARAALAGTPRP